MIIIFIIALIFLRNWCCRFVDNILFCHLSYQLIKISQLFRTNIMNLVQCYKIINLLILLSLNCLNLYILKFFIAMISLINIQLQQALLKDFHLSMNQSYYKNLFMFFEYIQSLLKHELDLLDLVIKLSILFDISLDLYSLISWLSSLTAQLKMILKRKRLFSS